ncbi:hypothetical protein [Algirhabdus cladophorae]|uniref:hypothetical protein n=1 Tax=Algirhabdus cladophorae TaxID=3377108 RepID=UPI003B847B4B
MKTTAIFAIGVATVAVAAGVYMIDIEQTQGASLPDVDISVEGGNMPEYDVDVGTIETGTQEITLDVPTIDIQSPEGDNG